MNCSSCRHVLFDVTEGYDYAAKDETCATGVAFCTRYPEWCAIAREHMEGRGMTSEVEDLVRGKAKAHYCGEYAAITEGV